MHDGIVADATVLQGGTVFKLAASIDCTQLTWMIPGFVTNLVLQGIDGRLWLDANGKAAARDELCVDHDVTVILRICACYRGVDRRAGNNLRSRLYGTSTIPGSRRGG